ncbi:MAG: tetratricopeptide repeat protein [Bacteroidota bacterium]
MIEGLITEVLDGVVTEIFNVSIKNVVKEKKLNRQIKHAIEVAEEEFKEIYQEKDPELISGIIENKLKLAELPVVKELVVGIITSPFEFKERIHRNETASYAAVLPEIADRRRVEEAVSLFISLIGKNILSIEDLQPHFVLYYQKNSSENSKGILQNTSDLVSLLKDIKKNLAEGSKLYDEKAKQQLPKHNLPQKNFPYFIGRRKEISLLKNLLKPYPESRHFLISIDGIGGVGKSTLALEIGHYFKEKYDELGEEKFDQIVWVSGKRDVLMAEGITERHEPFNTLEDLFNEIVHVAGQEEEYVKDGFHTEAMFIKNILSNNRTLLIIDNLETIDDSNLINFLREVPAPTKVIVTTRHRIDITYTIRLGSFSDDEALEIINLLIKDEIDLSLENKHKLIAHTGGVPLAIKWTIGRLKMGYGIEYVLNSLTNPTGDISEFCFRKSVEAIQKKPAINLLMALSLFEKSVNRRMLSEVVQMNERPDLEKFEEALGDLQKLSLINKTGDRFNMLPLTKNYALSELKKNSILSDALEQNWIETLIKYCDPFHVSEWEWKDFDLLMNEGEHIKTLSEWSFNRNKSGIFLKTIPPLYYYFNLIGRWEMVIHFGKLALNKAHELSDTESLIFVKSFCFAWIFGQQDKFSLAENQIKSAIQSADNESLAYWQYQTRILFSQIKRYQKQFDDAKELCNNALSFLGVQIDKHQKYVKADIKYELGKIARDEKKWEEAEANFIEAAKVFDTEEIGEVFNLERSWGLRANLGLVYYNQGRIEEAIEMYENSLDFFEKKGGKGYVSTIKLRLSTAYEEIGNNEKALELARESLDISETLHLNQEILQARKVIARLKKI